MAVKPKDFRPFFAAGVSALLAVTLGPLAAPLLAGGAPVGSYLVAVGGAGAARGIYLADVGQQPAVVSGPFLTATFAAGFRLTVLRDAPAAIVDAGNRLHRVDFSNPAAPAVTVSATLPFVINGATRLSAERDELLVVGDGGELAVIDPATLGIRASFALPSERIRVRTSRDGRLLVTQDSDSGVFLARFDAVSGAAAEVELQASGFAEAAFSRDNRTLVLHDSVCSGGLLGPPFCQTLLVIFDVADPAGPVLVDELDNGLDLITSSALDRSGGRIYFHQRGNNKWGGGLPHRLLPFQIAGAGDLTRETPIELTDSGDFQASGVVRTAGAKALLVCASETEIPDPPVARLHRYTLATGAVAVSPLPVPLEPRGIVHSGAAVFADGFESGSTGAWFPADDRPQAAAPVLRAGNSALATPRW